MKVQAVLAALEVLARDCNEAAWVWRECSLEKPGDRVDLCSVGTLVAVQRRYGPQPRGDAAAARGIAGLRQEARRKGPS